MVTKSKLAAGVAVLGVLMLGAFVIPAGAAEHRDDHRSGGDRGHDVRRGGGWSGGYYAAPPVVYAEPVYYPPPVVYGPGVAINLPGISVTVP